MDAKAELKEASIEVTVIRANGDREHHGVVSYYHRRWWKRLLWNLRNKGD